jgi:hypothetical protein
MTRQRRWQLKQNAKGLCALCAAAAVDGYHCARHLADNRDRYRNSYRLKHGIPLDAPIMRGRPRKELPPFS